MGRIVLNPPPQSGGSEVDTTQLEADITALDGRLDTLEGESLPMRMTDNEGIIDNHTSTINSHESRIDSAESNITMLDASMIVVNHGADANVARPANRLAVYWVGSVAPTNGEPQDLWYDTTT